MLSGREPWASVTEQARRGCSLVAHSSGGELGAGIWVYACAGQAVCSYPDVCRYPLAVPVLLAGLGCGLWCGTSCHQWLKDRPLGPWCVPLLTVLFQNG